MDLSVDKASTVLSQSPDGDHYKGFAIEPIQYTEANKLGFHEGNIIKYVTRWQLKNGVKDLRKARFYLDRLIQIEERRKPDLSVSDWQAQSSQNDMEDAVVAATARSGRGHERTIKERLISATGYDHDKGRFVGDERQIRPGIDFPN